VVILNVDMNLHKYVCRNLLFKVALMVMSSVIASMKVFMKASMLHVWWRWQPYGTVCLGCLCLVHGDAFTNFSFLDVHKDWVLFCFSGVLITLL